MRRAHWPHPSNWYYVSIDPHEPNDPRVSLATPVQFKASKHNRRLVYTRTIVPQTGNGVCV
jgi:hypothetical protein